jgi:hypothetical protein
MHDGPHLAHPRDLIDFGLATTAAVGHILADARTSNPDHYQHLVHAINHGARLRLVTTWTADAIGDTSLTVDVEGKQEVVGQLQAWPVR